MRHKKKVIYFFALTTITLGVTLAIFNEKTLAAPAAQEINFAGNFENAAIIKVDALWLSQNDYDNKITDQAKATNLTKLNQYIKDQAYGKYTRDDITGPQSYTHTYNGCKSEIKFQEDQWKLVNLRVVIGGQCTSVLKDNYDPVVTIGNAGNADIYFEWVTENTMERVDGKDGIFARIDNLKPNFYYRISEKGSTDQDYVETSSQTKGTYHRIKDLTNNPAFQPQPLATEIGKIANKSKPATDINTLGQEPPKNCDSEGGSLSWILCPLLFLGDNILRKLDQAILSLLTIPNDYYNNPDLKKTWSRLRDIAYVVLVVIMLIMVISTALGFDFISAYTVKKALPRLAIAVLFIALSFDITKFLIVFTNEIGASIHGLIVGSFTNDTTISIAKVFSPDGGDSVATVPLFAAAITGTFVIGSIGIILSYLFVGVIGLAVGFFLLSFRQMLLIALILVAPLAILAWIFPGNDKLWKLWWNTFSKLLLLFPLIMLLIAVGKVFALMVAETDGSFVSTLLKLVAYVGPYFLIPATFKFAGSAFANIAGIANNSSRGLLDRQKKYRQTKGADNWNKFKAGERGPAPFKRVGRGVGTAISAKRKRDLFTQGGWQAAVAQQDKLNEMAHGQSDLSKATKDNDLMLRAQTYASERQARAQMAADWGMSDENVETAITAARANGGFSAARQNYATRALVATGTGYESQDQLHKTIARVAGNNRAMAADLFGEANAVTKQVNRNDLAQGFSEHMAMYDSVQSRGGYASVAGTGGDILTAGEQVAAYTKAAKDIDPVTFMRNKPVGVTNMSGALNTSFRAAQAAGDTEEAAQLAGLIDKIEQSGGYASTTNIEIAGEGVVSPTSGAGAHAVILGPNGTPIAVPTAGRQAVVASTSTAQVKINPVTEKLETVTQYTTVINPSTGRTERIPRTDPDTGRPIPVANPTRDEKAAEIYKRNTGTRSNDPNDPNNVL